MDTEELQKLLNVTTPGPWGISHDEKWPFDITIGDGIVSMTRIAYSTRQNSLADVRAAVGFDWRERDNVAAMVAQQEADARLIALAPTLAAENIAMLADIANLTASLAAEVTRSEKLREAAEKLSAEVRLIVFNWDGEPEDMQAAIEALAAWEAAQ